MVFSPETQVPTSANLHTSQETQTGGTGGGHYSQFVASKLAVGAT